MNISTKGRYALRMLVDLARVQGDEFTSLNEISKRQSISKKYLEQIVPMLSKAGLLRTNRGNKGGYRLNVSPDKCTVADVLRATEGSLAPVACLEYEVNDCPRVSECNTLYIWRDFYKLTCEYFEGITLQSILEHTQKENSDFVI